MNWYSQAAYDLRFEWGLEGAKRLSSQADVSVIVDVLSFSTCVDVATARGASVFPFLFKDERAKVFAEELGGVLAEPQRSKDQVCLSPRTLRQLAPGAKLVLPSPNGSTIAFSIESPNVICGCLRNATAVARYASTVGNQILVIAAGERWPDGSLRPALEDIVGAGAILFKLPGKRSPEASWAIQSFEQVSGNLGQALRDCSSGRELLERGFPEDVDDAAEFDVSSGAPILKDKYFCLEG
jgi:2-phosphosulfolactate phosphatase